MINQFESLGDGFFTLGTPFDILPDILQRHPGFLEAFDDFNQGKVLIAEYPVLSFSLNKRKESLLIVIAKGMDTQASEPGDFSYGVEIFVTQQFDLDLTLGDIVRSVICPVK